MRETAAMGADINDREMTAKRAVMITHEPEAVNSPVASRAALRLETLGCYHICGFEGSWEGDENRG